MDSQQFESSVQNIPPDDLKMNPTFVEKSRATQEALRGVVGRFISTLRRKVCIDSGVVPLSRLKFMQRKNSCSLQFDYLPG